MQNRFSRLFLEPPARNRLKPFLEYFIRYLLEPFLIILAITKNHYKARLFFLEYQFLRDSTSCVKKKPIFPLEKKWTVIFYQTKSGINFKKIY